MATLQELIELVEAQGENPSLSLVLGYVLGVAQQAFPDADIDALIERIRREGREGITREQFSAWLDEAAKIIQRRR